MQAAKLCVTESDDRGGCSSAPAVLGSRAMPSLCPAGEFTDATGSDQLAHGRVTA